MGDRSSGTLRVAHVPPFCFFAIKFPPQRSLASARSELVETKFYRAELGEEMPILVYPPPGYFDSQQRYPALYMLGDESAMIGKGSGGVDGSSAVAGC